MTKINGRDGRAADPSRAAARLRGAYLLRRHALDLVGRALEAAGLRALLVKGAGLAETVYPEPWLRAMSDLDLVVAPAELDAALAALAAGGARLVAVPVGRRRSYARLGERAVLVAVGPVEVLVELHADLDKVFGRPVDWEGIRGRARSIPGLSDALRAPCRDDHALLVALHAALSELAHPAAWDDLERLFAAGVDVATLAARARSWRLATTTAVALDRFASLRPGRGAEAALAALGVPAARLAVARRTFAFERHGGGTDGLGWLVRQACLHDEPLGWLDAVGRYAALRVLDRLPW